tara:strand:- start:347 stop:514 length:168 start_codon:yes stop_codon:yes gene_type:complete
MNTQKYKDIVYGTALVGILATSLSLSVLAKGITKIYDLSVGKERQNDKDSEQGEK